MTEMCSFVISAQMLVITEDMWMRTLITRHYKLCDSKIAIMRDICTYIYAALVKNGMSCDSYMILFEAM